MLNQQIESDPKSNLFYETCHTPALLPTCTINIGSTFILKGISDKVESKTFMVYEEIPGSNLIEGILFFFLPCLTAASLNTDGLRVSCHNAEPLNK